MNIEVNNLGKNNIIEISDNVKHTGNLKINIEGNNNKLIIGENTRLGNGIIQIRNNQCEIKIGSFCMINGSFMCRANETKILIGKNTTMMNVQITLHEKGTITLGEDCMLSGNVRMDVSDMHSILDAQSLKRINPPKDITLGNHVWVAYGVNILKGNNIGDNSILGACSIITKDVPNNCIAVGIPAKVVKTGITWDRQCLPI